MLAHLGRLQVSLGRLECIRLLIDKGADRGLKNQQGRTAKEEAKRRMAERPLIKYSPDIEDAEARQQFVEQLNKIIELLT